MLDDKAFAAGFWALVGAVVLKIASWIVSRLTVPRDAVTQRMLQDMANDIAIVRDIANGIRTEQGLLSQRVATLEGRLNGRRDA